LSEPDAAEVSQHIAGCESCQSYANVLQPERLRTLLTPPVAAPAETPTANVDQPTAVHEMKSIASAAPAAAPPAIPPELVDHPRYRVLSLIGSGGMGSVYKAEHRLMERLVAIKVINRSLTGDPSAIERFRREVRTAARLTHPNIVTAFDADQVGDLHFLIMEFVDGPSLHKWVHKTGPLAMAEACNYIRQAALGLQYAHECGMVHRDVKPQNMLRTKAGEVKILDFGLARFASERRGSDSITGSGVAMGTPDYIAPEQANDARTADIRADIYSLGCTLYYLLSGQVPFPEETELQKFIAHMNKTPCSIREYRPDVPVALEAVLARMMAKKPDDRYQRPIDVANALTPFLIAAEQVGPSEAVELEAVEDDSPLLKLEVVEKAELAESRLPRKSELKQRRRELERQPGHLDEPEVVKEVPQETPQQRRSRLSRQLAYASVAFGVLAVPVTCFSCLYIVSAMLALVGLGLGLASGYFAYRADTGRYGWSIAGVCLNVVALLLYVGNDVVMAGNPPHWRSHLPFWEDAADHGFERAGAFDERWERKVTTSDIWSAFKEQKCVNLCGVAA